MPEDECCQNKQHSPWIRFKRNDREMIVSVIVPPATVGRFDESGGQSRPESPIFYGHRYPNIEICSEN